MQGRDCSREGQLREETRMDCPKLQNLLAATGNATARDEQRASHQLGSSLFNRGCTQFAKEEKGEKQVDSMVRPIEDLC